MSLWQLTNFATKAQRLKGFTKKNRKLTFSYVQTDTLPNSFLKMRRKVIIFLLGYCIVPLSFGQRVCNDFYYKTFTRQELAADVDYIKEKILNAHINPFTEISESEFESQIRTIKDALKDGMTQRDFYFLMAPALVKLNDEHSGLSDFCVTDSIKSNWKIFPLRFKLRNEKVLLTENYSNETMELGDELLTINKIPISEISENCSKLVFGTKDDRKATFIENLWIYIYKLCYFFNDDFQLTFSSGKNITIKGLSKEEFTKNFNLRNKKTDPQRITYENINGTGYFEINTFVVDDKNSLSDWRTKIDSIFKVIKSEQVNTLFIDISKNGGGNSQVGNIIIDYFSDQSYKTYSGRWKKSQEYADYLKKAGSPNPEYEKLKDGEVMPLKSSTVTPGKNPNRFNGRTYVVVGENTFSSAIMFAVTILDNKLATVIGESPSKGHPNHFGELIAFKTPNTQLTFIFGVKEWIRPSGVLENNQLVPDIKINLSGKTKEDIIKLVE